MPQPLHNGAIPAHPGIAANIEAQTTGVVAPASAPEPRTPVDNSQALFDAFEGDSADSSPSIPDAPAVPSVTPPTPPPPIPELPPTVDDLLSGAETSVPVQQPVEPVAAPQPAQAPIQQQQVAAPPVDFAQMQQRAIDYLMGNEYRLSDEDRTQLISAPDEVLPRLAARMHVGIATQLAQQVAQAIPHMIQQHMETHVKAQRAEMEFFSRYPKLNNDAWKPTIAESLQMVRQMKPTATREEIIREGAALAAFRIQSSFGNRHAQQQPQPPRAPSQPYVPVHAGGGLPPPANPATQNPWAQLADEDWNPF